MSITQVTASQIAYTTATPDRTVESKLSDFVDVRDFGAVGDGATDDTAAFRAALAAIVAQGGGALYVPAAHYVLSSAFNTANGQNSLLPLPHLVPGTNAQIPIRIVGDGAVSAFGPPDPNTGTVISTPNAGTTTNGIASSIIGFGSSTIAVTSWTAVTLQIENIAFKTPVNGGVVGIDAYACANCVLDNVTVVVDVAPGTESAPTNTNTIGIKLPATGNYGIVKARNVYVTGQYHGIWHTEHADIEALINLCVCALYIPANYSHLAKYKITTQGCSYSVWCDAVAGALQCTSIYGSLDIERDPSFVFLADFQVSAGCGLYGWLSYNVAADPNSLFSVYGPGAFGVVMQSVARPQKVISANATVTCNGWFFAVVPSALSGPITVTIKTLNPGYVPGQRLRVYGNYAYNVTIQSDVTSYDPKFYFPDNSNAYSMVIPSGHGSAQYAEFTWDGLDWRVITEGLKIVDNATAANHALAMGQFDGRSQSAGFTPVSGTAYQNVYTCPITLYIPVSYTGAGTAVAQIGPSTGALLNAAQDVGATSQVKTISIRVPAGWYYKLTVTNGTIGGALSVEI